MKAIQLTIDEELLRELDASDEVKRAGRSAVIRRATAEYLARAKKQAISQRYLRGYGDSGALGRELAGWSEEGAWPDD